MCYQLQAITSKEGVYKLSEKAMDPYGPPDAFALLFETNMTYGDARALHSLYGSEDEKAIEGLLASLHGLSEIYWEAAFNTTEVEGLGAGQYVCGAFAGMMVFPEDATRADEDSLFLLVGDSMNRPRGKTGRWLKPPSSLVYSRMGSNPLHMDSSVDITWPPTNVHTHAVHAGDWHFSSFKEAEALLECVHPVGPWGSAHTLNFTMSFVVPDMGPAYCTNLQRIMVDILVGLFDLSSYDNQTSWNVTRNCHMRDMQELDWPTALDQKPKAPKLYTVEGQVSRPRTSGTSMWLP